MSDNRFLRLYCTKPLSVPCDILTRSLSRMSFCDARALIGEALTMVAMPKSRTKVVKFKARFTVARSATHRTSYSLQFIYVNRVVHSISNL